MTQALESIAKLKRDIRAASVTLSESEARFLVDTYYAWQEDRKRANNQVRALDESAEPHEVVRWLAEQSTTLENEIKKVLGVFAESRPIGKWMLAQHGIGPVISAGLIAHIDISKAITAGHIWRYAGLDPTQVWGKGEKRPWNASLKVIAWKAGQSFMKFAASDECFYGKIYRERKAYEVARNDSGGNAVRAAEILTEKKIGKATEAYKHLTGGKLPPAQIDARARRYAVKIFLAHFQTAAWFAEFGVLPPAPYAMVFAGHAHRIDPPHASVIPGLAEALKKQP
jgi:hypothetical protein